MSSLRYAPGHPPGVMATYKPMPCLIGPPETNPFPTFGCLKECRLRRLARIVLSDRVSDPTPSEGTVRRFSRHREFSIPALITLVRISESPCGCDARPTRVGDGAWLRANHAGSTWPVERDHVSRRVDVRTGGRAINGAVAGSAR